ncbi:MAG: alpha/beta fold hydrolase, partial [Candidatus Levyibacteriota bacterium]
SLTFNDYLLFVKKYIEEILKKEKVKKIVLIGHSFGGRIGIYLSALYPDMIDSLVLTGASGISRSLPSLRKRIVFILTKIFRPIFLLPFISSFYRLFRKAVYYSIGEMDYYKAGKLSETFKNVYKVSVLDELKKIHIPTLIVWGSLDTITPLDDARKMHEGIKGSKLVFVKNATHKLPYQMPIDFSTIILEFIK